jgi:Arc/MetJ family transcription regulator
MNQVAIEASKHQLSYALMPRTTLTIDTDVAAELARRRRERGTTMKQEVNDLLRAGLELANEPSAGSGRFETKALPLGKPRLENFDDIAEVLAFAEGEGHL